MTLGNRKEMAVRISGALALAASCTLGCGATGEATTEDLADPTGTVEEELNGTITFPDTSCQSVGADGTINVAGGRDFRGLIQQGATRARSHLNQGNMPLCLAQVFGSAHNGDSAETIVANMRENLSTAVICRNLADTAGADAPLLTPGQPETTRINSADLSGHTEFSMAGLLLHEVAHNKGYDHSKDHNGSEYPFTVNEQLAACSRAMSGQTPSVGGPGPVPFANGPQRSELTRATQLSHVGGGGGNRFTRSCFSGGFARGLVGRSGARIDAVSLLCTDRAGNGTEALPQVGGGGGGPFTMDCGHGRVMVGIRGNADNLVNGLGPLCADAAVVAANTGPAPLFAGNFLGTQTGPAFMRTCPQGKAVKTAYLRAGSLVDQIKLECEKLTEGYLQIQSALTTVGDGSHGVPYRERCPVGSVMNGLSGQQDKGIGWIYRLGGTCREVRDDGASVSLLTTNVTPVCDNFGCRGRGSTIPLQAQGANGLVAWNDEACRSGSALIGMIIQTGVETGLVSPIRRVRGMCANVVDWSTASRNPVVEQLNDHGGGTASPPSTTVTCPRGQFITGWDIRADANGVWQLAPVCTLSSDSGGGQNCSSRCTTICTQTVTPPIDIDGVNRCLNECNARCAN